MRQPFIACLCQLAFVASALAQSVNVTLDDPPTMPAQPTSDLPVSARVHIVACDNIPIVPVRNGQVIDLHYQNRNCPTIPTQSEATVPLGSLFQGAYLLRVVETSDSANPRVDDEATFVVTPVNCPSHPLSPSIPQLCLRGGRFSVFAVWATLPSGAGKPTKLSSNSGAMWFFTPDNVELMVKVLDACHYNGHFWFFAAGLTDLPVFITVRDNQTGAQRMYQNPAGTAFRAITDTSAFACQ